MIAANVSAEQALLCAAMISPDAIDHWGVAPSEFTHPRYRVLAESMVRLRGRMEPIDPVTLEADFAARRVTSVTIADVSDVLAGWASTDPAAIAVHAGLVREIAGKRDIVEETTRMLALLNDGHLDTAGALAELNRIAAKIHDRSGQNNRNRPMPEVVKDLWAELEARCNSESPTGVRTGLPDLDNAMGGIRPGVLTILGGRTGKGKSSLARTIASNASARGEGVHYFSFEDKDRMLAERELADRARVNLQILASPRDGMTKGHMGNLASAANDLRARTSWVVNDMAGQSSAQIAANVRRCKRDLRTKLVVVDYISKIHEKGQDKRERIDTALDGLDVLARQEDVAVLVLAQLLRAADTEDRPPRLADLKESGALEEMASCVMLIHREDPETKKPGERAACGVIVAKNKAGRPGLFVNLAWDGPTATYRSAARQEYA